MADIAGKSPNSDQMRELRLQRNLKILVVGLGVLIVAALAAIVGKIAMMATSSGAAPSAAAPQSEIALEIPKGARIVSTALSANRLIVHHEGPLGTGIVILDIETGRRLAEIKPFEAVPKN